MTIFLWGYHKSRLYDTKLNTLNELKDSICQQIAQIDRIVLDRIETNFLKRLQQCKNRRHLENVIFTIEYH